MASNTGLGIANGIGFKNINRGGITLPPWFKKSIVCWYDIPRQNPTNDSLSKNPILKDYSGHNLEAQLKGFNWNENSGINNSSYPNALIFDGRKDYAVSINQPILINYTIIVKREWLSANMSFLASKYKDNTDQSAFAFESYMTEGGGFNVETHSFGIKTLVETSIKEPITYQTTESYNGKTIRYNTNVDDSDTLYIGTFYEGFGRYANIALYQLLLFNKKLSKDEIQWIINHILVDEPYLLVEDDTPLLLENNEPIRIKY